MRKEKSRDRLEAKVVVHQTENFIKDELLLFREWITDYGKIILPLALLILVSVTVVISLNARERVEEAAKEALEVLEETKSEVMDVQETLFEEDAYPEINELIHKYYEALEMADIDVLIDIQSAVTATESIRLQKMSEYIDRYENIHVHTKPGPYLDSFIAYVYSEVYLKDIEVATPGLQAFYICMNEEGLYYINNSELSEEEALYIKNVANQGDVMDLKNSVNVAYSNLMEENTELSEDWAKISVEIDLAVGEQIALDAKLQAQLEEPVEEEVVEEEPVESEEPRILMVRATEQVNIRKSASASGDKLGSASKGDTFVLLEQMANGWSKISYESKEAYISSEYLELMEDVSNLEVKETLMVNTSSLNVRAEADQTSTKLGVLVYGQMVDVLETADGWCKIKFDGQVGYVKADYIN